MSLGVILGSIFERPGVSWRGPGGVPGRPGGVLGRPWRPLGGLLELFKVPGRLRGGFWGRMGRYGRPLEAHFGALFGSLFGIIFRMQMRQRDFLIFNTPLERFACFYGSGWLEICSTIT